MKLTGVTFKRVVKAARRNLKKIAGLNLHFGVTVGIKWGILIIVNASNFSELVTNLR